jgi:protein involved in polysaccharide export with SLBB domain
VRDLVAAAQGLTEFAHTEQAALWRMNNELDYEVTRFDLAAAMRSEPASNLVLAPRDRVIVYAEENVERPSEVQVEGAVRFPSLLPWTLGMCVSDAVLQSGGLTDAAYTARAQILRVGPDQRRAMVTVELAKALAGDAAANLRLERGDMLRVFTRAEVTPESAVVVGGFVREPGEYPRFQGMRVSDAILLAGGLDANAGDEVEYAQFGDTDDVQPVYLTLSRVGDDFRVEPDPVLTDNDHVAVLGVGENIAAPRVVTIKGFVDRPGTYALRGGLNDIETVYNLIEQAGGLLDSANPNGIVLYRLREEIIAEEQEADLRQVIAHFNRELVSDTVEGQTQRMSGVAGTVTAGLTAALSEGGSAVVVPPRKLNGSAWAQAIPIDGGRLIETSGREGDFALINGDVVIVPTMPRTVTVLGAVIRPGALAFVEGQLAMEFINQAGGPAPDGKPSRLIIIRANGSVAPNAMRAQVMPGDVLLVPSDYLIKHIDKPDTLDRILGAVGAALTGYLIFR